MRDRERRADRPLCSSPNMDRCNALQVPAAGVGASGPSQSDGRWNISHEDASFTGSTVRAESILSVPHPACGMRVRPREGLMRLMVSRGFTLHQSVAQIARLPQEMARTGSKVVILDGMLVMHLDPQVSSRESRALLRRSLSVLERLSGEGVQLLVTTEDREHPSSCALAASAGCRPEQLRSHPPPTSAPIRLPSPASDGLVTLDRFGLFKERCFLEP